MNFGESLFIQSLRQPDKTAIKYGSRNICFRDLNRRVNSLSHALLELGMKKGDLVCQLQGNTIEHFELLYAIAKTGTIRLPLNPRGNVAEWANIINNFKPFVLVYDRDFKPLVAQIQSELDCRLHLITVGGDAYTGIFSYEEFASDFSQKEPDIAVNEEDPYIIQSTSGSTGFPKAALLSHIATIHRVLIRAVDMGNSSNGIYLAATSLANTASTFYGLCQLYLGGTVIIHNKFDPSVFLKTIEEEKVTNSSLVPVMGERLLDAQKEGHCHLTSLQFLIVYGAPLNSNTRQRLIGEITPNVFEVYGMTETGPITILGPHDRKEGGSVGLPTSHTTIRILEEEGRRDPREKGEIVVKTPYLFNGYLNNPKETGKVLINGWFHTGDIGSLDGEGYLHIIGRSKNMIISGGYNIYEEEVETVLSEHPLVKEAAVIGVPDRDWGEVVKAVVVLKPHAHATEEEIIGFCRQKLPSYKKPRSVNFVDELPRLSSGKLEKQKLRNYYIS